MQSLFYFTSLCLIVSILGAMDKNGDPVPMFGHYDENHFCHKEFLFLYIAI